MITGYEMFSTAREDFRTIWPPGTVLQAQMLGLRDLCVVTVLDWTNIDLGGGGRQSWAAEVLMPDGTVGYPMHVSALRGEDDE